MKAPSVRRVDLGRAGHGNAPARSPDADLSNGSNPQVKYLTHFSKRPFADEVRPIGPQAGPGRQATGTHKPVGLWLSDESSFLSWTGWCQREEFPCGGHRTHFRIPWVRRFAESPHGGGTVLWLATEREMMMFDAYYGLTYHCHRGEWELDHSTEIDEIWERLTMDYDGIIISPYQARLATLVPWYYSWDCASACIWNHERLNEWRVPESD